MFSTVCIIEFYSVFTSLKGLISGLDLRF